MIIDETRKEMKMKKKRKKRKEKCGKFLEMS